MDLETIIGSILNDLNEKDSYREDVIKLSRTLNRISGRGIAMLMQDEDVDHQIQQGKELMVQITNKMVNIAQITSWGLTISGVEEFCEFLILHDLLKTGSINSPEESNIPNWIWLTALCDVVGELRRIILRKLINKDLDKAKELFKHMEMIYFNVSGIVFSKNLVSNLRRKMDMIRAVMEKTESDMANAIISINR